MTTGGYVTCLGAFMGYTLKYAHGLLCCEANLQNWILSEKNGGLILRMKCSSTDEL